MRAVLMIVGITILFILLTIRIFCGISFDLKCEQYLKRAADANTVELAKQNLEVAIQYLEKNDLTNGIVSVFLQQPGNDIGFWYTNLKASYNELDILKPDSAQLEKSNILMKLRETLLDHGKEGVSVTGPSGMSIYPYNALFFWIGTIALIMAIQGIFGILSDN